ncbi:MAG: hypothetical protein H0X51_05545 [Parachlamydiaceae bacterium]|nr:hypothetical protein [Parachlamydiaceae bacterium]
MKNTPSKVPRIFAILQLCIAFTIVMSNAGYPFLGELFNYKTKALLYHHVMGDETLTASPEIKQKLQRNQERFQDLPRIQQTQIRDEYQVITQHRDRSATEKLRRSWNILAFELPAFERAWLLFAILISILILCRRDGAVRASWLLPALAFCYAYDNYTYGQTPPQAADAILFPSEAEIVEDYISEPLSDTIMEQHAQLLKGWQHYLIREWANESRSEDPEIFALQVEQGEFAFNLKRLELIAQEKSSINPFREKESLALLILYLIWNFWFAWAINRYSPGVRENVCLHV